MINLEFRHHMLRFFCTQMHPSNGLVLINMQVGLGTMIGRLCNHGVKDVVGEKYSHEDWDVQVFDATIEAIDH